MRDEGVDDGGDVETGFLTVAAHRPLPDGRGSPGRGSAAELRQRAVRGGLILLSTRLTTQVFVWAVTLVVARLLRPYDYGLMTSGMLLVGLADLLAEAGMGKALIQKEDLRPSDLAEGFTLTLLVSAALYGLLFGIAGPAADYLQTPEFRDFLRVLGVLLLLVPFRTIPLALLDRGLRLGKQSTVHVACAVVQSLVVLGLALAGQGYWSLAAGVLAARMLEVLALAYFAGWRPRLALPYGRRSVGLLVFGLHVSLGSLLWFVYTNSDYAVVGKLAGPVALGYYAFAFQLISMPVQKLTANVNQVAYPVFCRLRHDPGRVRDWYLRLTVLLGFIGMPVLAGMALVAEDAFAVVLGEKWADAVVPFQLLSGAGVVMIFSASLPPLLNALGRPDINLKFTAACTLVLPAGFVVFGARYGLTGVCAVWLVVYPLLVAGLVVFTRELTGIRLADLLRAQAPVLCGLALMALVVRGLRWQMADLDPGWLRLVSCIGAGAVGYGIFMVLLARGTVLTDVRKLLREVRGQQKG